MTRPSPSELTNSLKAEAHRLGFSLFGVAPATIPTGFGRFLDWLHAGYAGEMHYLPRRNAAYEHPQSILDNVHSVVMLGIDYDSGMPRTCPPGFGKLARYSWGDRDYHDVVFEKLDCLAAFAVQSKPAAHVRGVVDTAPLLEREFAQLAGLGWQGKNTMLINPQRGSYFFLAALLVDFDLEFTVPFQTDHCGTCTRCLDACPTKAFVKPYVLDATKCISYLTIELKSPMAEELREKTGDWVLGCDICQEVCPWNRFAPGPPTNGAVKGLDNGIIELSQLFEMSDEQFRARFRETPMWRPRRRGILRNAAIVLGNQRCEAATGALILGLNDIEPLVRGAAAWALGKIGTDVAVAAVRTRLTIETDLQVLDELQKVMERGS